MKKTTTSGWMLLACAMLIGTPIFVSCSSDKDIDLGELDKTIGIGSDGFQLPTSSTKDSPLGDLLELKDDGVIDTLTHDSAGFKKGDYQFKKNDAISPSNPKVKEVKITNNGEESQEKLPVSLFSEMSSDDAETLYYFGDPTGITSLSDVKDITKCVPKKVKEIDFTGDGNKEIIKLTKADVDGTMTLTLDMQAINNKVSNIHGINIYLPKFLKLKNSNYDITDTDNNILRISNISSTSSYPIQLQLDYLDDIKMADPSTQAEKDKGYMVFNSNGMKMHCVVKMVMILKRGDIYTTAIPASGEQKYDIEATIEKIKEGEGFTVYHAEGYFDPDIKLDNKNTDISGVPDFLDDDRVKILLNDPTIKLDIENNVDVEAIMTGSLVANYKDGTKRKLELTKNKNIVMRRSSESTKTTILINRKGGTDDDVTSTYYVKLNTPGITDLGSKTYEVFDIDSILSKIPESIDFDFDAEANHDFTDPVANPPATIDLYANDTTTNKRGLRYEIKPTYEFVAPLALEAGSTIVYNDTINDWNKDIKDNKINFYGEGHLMVEASIDNNTPLELVISKPTAIGLEKKVISDAKVEIVDDNGNVQKALTVYKKGDSKNKKLRLKISGNLDNLDGVIFEVVANATQATPEVLNASGHTVKIKDMKISLNGRVTLNLDD